MSYKMDKLDILVADKSSHMCDLIKTILVAFGVQNIDIVHNYKKAEMSLKHKEYDIMIMDWDLEQMSGINFTKQIRQNTHNDMFDIPIIFITGYSDRNCVTSARDAGITEFLAKPFTPKALYRRIEHIIEHPRPFIKSNNYNGPDRRRMIDQDYNQTDRRRSEQEEQPDDKETIYL